MERLIKKHAFNSCMVQRTDYGKYLFGTGRKKLEELAIFEIGGSYGPICRSLPQRNAKRVIYREINTPDSFLIISNAELRRYREQYASISRQMLREHCGAAEGIDELRIPWYAQDVPYPFPDNSFDEFHSHMVTSRIVGYEKTGHRPSPESFADEVARLLKREGRLYLSTDTPYFFGSRKSQTLPAFGEERAELADRLIQSLRAKGFTMNVVDCYFSLQEDLQGKNYGVPIGEVDWGAVMRNFSRQSGAHVDLVIIATKAPHPGHSK